MSTTSIRRHTTGALVGAPCLVLAALLIGCGQESGPPKGAAPAKAPSQAAPAKGPSQAAPAKTASNEPAAATPVGQQEAKAPGAKTTSKGGEETVEVGSCDGEKTVTVSKTLTGQALADDLMDQWKRAHPEANWVAEEQQKHALKPPADNSDLLKGGQAKGNTYRNYTKRDLLTWTRETEKFVAEGSRIFHSGDALGSTVGVSCDMCHPHAANTHPETYPKFQTQLGRVALLRDMIEWCIENPVRGKHLQPDSPTMRALEAYILSQRKGVAMNYGKH